MPRAEQFSPPTLADAWQAGTLILAEARRFMIRRRGSSLWEPMVVPAFDDGMGGTVPEHIVPYDAACRVRCRKTNRACPPDRMFDVRGIPNTRIAGDFVDAYLVSEHDRDGRVPRWEFLQMLGASASIVAAARAAGRRPARRRRA